MIEWLLSGILFIVGLLIGFVSSTKSHNKKESRRREEHLDTLKKDKELQEHVQSLDDDRIISEYDRLHEQRRRNSK